jgi:hypothetical protein
VDESGGADSGFDRLYIDLNRDRDLTNDAPIRVMKDPPEWPYPVSEDCKATCFDAIQPEFDYGPGVGKRPFELIPRFMIWEGGYASLNFVASQARQDAIRFGSHKFDAYLVQRHAISGRFDRSFVSLILCKPGEENEAYRWWGGDTLAAMHRIDDFYYRLAASPTGEKVTVEPYNGDLGIFKIGPGDRKLDKLTIAGSLSNPSAAVAVGELNDEWPTPVEKVTLPVGDYTATYLNLEFGKLRINLSSNYHADGKPRGRDGEPAYEIRIRKNKPFVFDLTNKPDVMFASPAKDQQFTPGDEISVKGVLIDPKLDLMIRGLDDTSQKVNEELHFGDGETIMTKRDKSLDPSVVITDSAGKRLAEGVMPFG